MSTATSDIVTGVLFEFFLTCVIREQIEGYIHLVSLYSNEYRGSDGSSSGGRTFPCCRQQDENTGFMAELLVSRSSRK
jgi:hypothetical protein